MTLTKAELADMLFEKVGLNKREAKDMVETFFEEIRLALENGESVKLSGFGNFQLRDKPQRPGRNPKTGEEIPITARRVVTFHALRALRFSTTREVYWLSVRVYSAGSLVSCCIRPSASVSRGTKSVLTSRRCDHL